MSHVEDRRGNAICYRNRKKTMLWQADYIGVLAMESGDKYWVRIYEKRTSSGDPCIGVSLQLKEDS